MQWFDKIFHLQTLVYIKYNLDFLTRFSPLFRRQVQRRRPLSRPAVLPLTIRRRRLRRLPPPQPRPTSSRLLQILWALLPKPCWPKCKQKCNYVLISKIAFACNKKLLGNILSWNQITLGSSIFIHIFRKSPFILRTQIRDRHFFQKCCHFRWLCFDFSFWMKWGSRNWVLKMNEL